MSVGFKPVPPPAEGPRGPAQNVRGSKPMQLAAERLQHDLLHRHRTLPRGLRIRHRASWTRCRIPTGHKVKAVRSLALRSGQIMYSLQRRTTDEPVSATEARMASDVRVIIVGGGEIGFALAQALAANNEVVVIDH